MKLYAVYHGGGKPVLEEMEVQKETSLLVHLDRRYASVQHLSRIPKEEIGRRVFRTKAEALESYRARCEKAVTDTLAALAVRKADLAHAEQWLKEMEGESDGE